MTPKPKTAALSAALKGKRTYATLTALATVVLAQKLRRHLPDDAAAVLASDLVEYAELGLAALAMYFRAKANGGVEHSDTQSTPSTGPNF